MDKDKLIEATVIGVSRHRMMTDGQGVTTLVAFHGCPLQCKYCLNPQCHDEQEAFRRYTPESLLQELMVDDLYFRATGGGVTFGGGEPLLQTDFILKFRELCGPDWRIAVETSLNVSADSVRRVATAVDEWIIDLKSDNDMIYRAYTKNNFGLVRRNLAILSEMGVSPEQILLRIPVIPGYTDMEDAEATRDNYEQKGYTRFDLFTYETQRRQVNPNANGKRICEVLKAIRRELASNNDLDFTERECTHQGDCPGTCPLCEHELQTLHRQLQAINAPDLNVSDYLLEAINPPMKETPPQDSHLIGERLFSEAWDGEIIPCKPEFRRVFFKECAVAGVSFHLEVDDPLWDELYVGAKLALVRERKNKFDRNAVAVALASDYDGDPDSFDFDFILGYIPRDCNTEIAAMMDAGYDDKFVAEISSLSRHGNINNRIRITIWLLSKDPIDAATKRLRLWPLDDSDMGKALSELRHRGTAHLREHCDHASMEEGDEIVLISRRADQVMLCHMRLLATGEDAMPYLDNPEECQADDDQVTYVFTNIAGPHIVAASELNFLQFPSHEWLDAAESDSLARLLHSLTLWP